MFLKGGRNFVKGKKMILSDKWGFGLFGFPERWWAKVAGMVALAGVIVVFFNPLGFYLIIGGLVFHIINTH